jgi:DNA-binding response OmpR family regulator
MTRAVVAGGKVQVTSRPVDKFDRRKATRRHTSGPDRQRVFLLSVLAVAGEILSKRQCGMVWDINFDSDANVVEVAIKRLRPSSTGRSRKLRTIRGIGYVLESRGVQ